MKISENCYVIYGLTTIPPWMVNSGFITGGERTLVVDCGGNYLSAKTVYGYAQCAKPGNELVAINTEPHFDHIGGNCFFRDKGIDVYGHEGINRSDEELEAIKDEYSKTILSETRREMREENLVFYNTRAINPNRKVTSDFAMDLGGFEVEIILTPGHTPMNLSVYVPEEKVLYCGDAIVTDYFPNLEDGGENDWEQWLHSLETIKELSPEIIVPGHGEILTGNQIEKEFLRMKSIIEQALEKVV